MKYVQFNPFILVRITALKYFVIYIHICKSKFTKKKPYTASPKPDTNNSQCTKNDFLKT